MPAHAESAAPDPYDEERDEQDPAGISVSEIFRRFGPLARPDRRTLVLACLLVLFCVITEAAVVIVFMDITDTALAAGSLRAFWGPAGVWVAITLLGALAGYGRDMLTSLCEERFLLRLRDLVFTHVQKMSPDFFTTRETGDLVVRSRVI